jgi:hypothetical protein
MQRDRELNLKDSVAIQRALEQLHLLKQLMQRVEVVLHQADTLMLKAILLKLKVIDVTQRVIIQSLLV